MRRVSEFPHIRLWRFNISTNVFPVSMNYMIRIYYAAGTLRTCLIHVFN